MKSCSSRTVIVMGLLIFGTLKQRAQRREIAISAEGIENPNQHERLVREGLAEGQGRLFGRPLTAAEADKLVLNRMADISPRRA